MLLLPPPERLNVIHRARLARLRAAAALAATRAFDRISDPAADASAFLADVVPIALGAQAAMVAEVDAYLSLVAGVVTGSDRAPVGIDAAQIVGAKARNGNVLETVYRRPLWEWERRQAELFARAAGEMPDGPIRRQSSIGREQIRLFARSRIAQDIVTDLQLVQRDATWARMQIDPRLPRWRRVTSGESCPLCTVAATNTYAAIRRIQLHPGCDCGIEPLVDGDVMSTPNVRQLPDVYRRLVEVRQPGSGINAKADANGPVVLYPDLLNTKLVDLPKVEVVHHDELGPVLWDAAHEFVA